MVWQRILTNVRLQHPSLNRVWFDQMTPRQLTNGVIQVTVATPAQLNFCQSQCQQPFTVAAQAGDRPAASRSAFIASTCPAAGCSMKGISLLPLNPDYVFENFVTGPCNRLPHAASVAVAEQPGKAYNPLFIHGGVGLGKTHLLQAVCQKVLERNGDARILYLSCDSFINQFITAVETGDMNQFRYRYRHVDMLVIDDIHFLGRHRDRTQEEFFHTFNTLYQQHKQIILSADCPPSEIPELEERLVSRFNWGLVARIEKPCYETRVAILQKKARMRGLLLPEDVVCYVAAQGREQHPRAGRRDHQASGHEHAQQRRDRSRSGQSRPGRHRDARAEAHHHPADLRRRDQVLQRPPVAIFRARSGTSASPSRGRSACSSPAGTRATAWKKSAATSAAAITRPSCTPSAPSTAIARTTPISIARSRRSIRN